MSEKKRTTVTTIETHEIWIIRKAVPKPADEAITIRTVETGGPATLASPLSVLGGVSETSEEQEHEE